MFTVIFASLAFFQAIAKTEALAACTNTREQLWNAVAEGENAFMVDIKSNDKDGHSFFVYCLPKGPVGNVLDPWIETKLHGTYEIHSGSKIYIYILS
jgi:hypothetical protein